MTDLMTRQAELESDSVLLGQHRYAASRKNQGESATSPGKYQTQEALPALAQAIELFVEQAAKPDVAGRKHRALPYLLHILPEQAAYLTIRYAIDGAAANQKINTLALALGSAVEDHIHLLKLSEQEFTGADGEVRTGGLYRKVMEQVKKATSERHRKAVLRHVVAKYAVDTLDWSDTDKLHLGTKLVELLDETSTLVTLRRDTEGHHNTPVKIVFTDEAQAWFDQSHDRASTWSPVHLPMIAPPRDWHIEESTTHMPADGVGPSLLRKRIVGGYITRAIRRANMVQSRLPGGLARMVNAGMQNVFDAVNATQRTPWRINRQLLAVMREARTGGDRFQSLFVEADLPLPARPAGVSLSIGMDQLTLDQREALMSWKRDAALVYESNARLRSKRIGVAQKLWVANKFVDEAAIYFPHYLDFRGRIYPFASYLNPQSSDTGRALLEFAEGKVLGERGLFWLKVHIANLFGVDKVSFEERVKWVNGNLEALLDSAALPLDGMQLWVTADSGKNKWQALAACMELAGALVAGRAYVSHMPIAMDGSCSGLQHYSAMLRDPVGGAAVNLVPQQKPGDIYTEVATRAQALIDRSTDGMAACWKGGKVVRKIAKQPTMTLCYSATVFGMQSQIAKAVEGLGGAEYLGGADVRPSCVYMAGVIWDAIGATVVAAKEAMGFLKEIAKLAAEADMPIKWTAPSGFLVEQGYREPIGKRVHLHYKGIELKLMLTRDGDKLARKKQVASVAPNFVHSLDSAHLMATVNLGTDNGLTHWACIHDSFGVHAADVDTLHACIRESFIEQYTPDVLARLREEIVAQLPAELAEKIPAVPLQGTLDLAAVRDSAYFFA
jgi:DNA-directed RNA polymerase